MHFFAPKMWAPRRESHVHKGYLDAYVNHRVAYKKKGDESKAEADAALDVAVTPKRQSPPQTGQESAEGRGKDKPSHSQSNLP